MSDEEKDEIIRSRKSQDDKQESPKCHVKQLSSLKSHEEEDDEEAEQEERPTKKTARGAGMRFGRMDKTMTNPLFLSSQMMF